MIGENRGNSSFFFPPLSLLLPFSSSRASAETRSRTRPLRAFFLCLRPRAPGLRSARGDSRPGVNRSSFPFSFPRGRGEKGFFFFFLFFLSLFPFPFLLLWSSRAGRARLPASVMQVSFFHSLSFSSLHRAQQGVELWTECGEKEEREEER